MCIRGAEGSMWNTVLEVSHAKEVVSRSAIARVRYKMAVTSLMPSKSCTRISFMVHPMGNI